MPRAASAANDEGRRPETPPLDEARIVTSLFFKHVTLFVVQLGRMDEADLAASRIRLQYPRDVFHLAKAGPTAICIA